MRAIPNRKEGTRKVMSTPKSNAPIRLSFFLCLLRTAEETSWRCAPAENDVGYVLLHAKM